MFHNTFPAFDNGPLYFESDKREWGQAGVTLLLWMRREAAQGAWAFQVCCYLLKMTGLLVTVFLSHKDKFYLNMEDTKFVLLRMEVRPNMLAKG